MKALIVVSLAIAACGPKHAPPHDNGVPWGRSGIDWSKPPAVAETPATVPAITERKVGDIRVLVVENHRLPFVAITAVNDEAGGRTDNYPHPGLAGLTLDVLAEAAPAHPGIHLDTAIATDYASVQVVARREDAFKASALIANMLSKPVFDDKVVDRVRVRRVATLRERESRQRTIAGQAFDGTVFFGHPYRIPADGTADDVAKLTFLQVLGFHTSFYSPKQLTLVIAGDVDAAAINGIGAAFANWSAKPQPALPALAVPHFAPKLSYIDMPGATQSVVLVGAQAAKAGESTQIAADVENMVLGGGPGSRLDAQLEQKMAITTGAGSSFWRGHYAGSWSVAATFPTQRTGEGLKAVIAEIEKARGADASDAEIARAKQTLARALGQQFETTAGMARALERMVGLRLPADWFTSYLAALPGVTAADARSAVAATWKQPTIVVAGDWAKLKDDLAGMGYTVTPYTP